MPINIQRQWRRLLAQLGLGSDVQVTTADGGDASVSSEGHGVRHFLHLRLEEIEKYTGVPVIVTAHVADGRVYVAIKGSIGESSRYPFKSILAEFHLMQLPGCCGVVVSTGSWIIPELRGKGFGSYLNTLRQDLARDLDYGYILCTDISTNLPQRALLKRQGWSDLTLFRNPKTGNEVYISGKQLRKEYT